MIRIRNDTGSPGDVERKQEVLSTPYLWEGGFGKNTGDYIILPYPAGKEFLVLDF